MRHIETPDAPEVPNTHTHRANSTNRCIRGLGGSGAWVTEEGDGHAGIFRINVCTSCQASTEKEKQEARRDREKACTPTDIEFFLRSISCIKRKHIPEEDSRQSRVNE